MYIKHIFSFKMPSELIFKGVFLNDLGKWGDKYDFSKGLQNYHKFELNGHNELINFENNIMDSLYKQGGKEIGYRDYLCNDKGEIIRECKEFYKYDSTGRPLNQKGELIKLN
jgi:hypothetical protein